ncbi:MAG: hypothetical protein Q8Q39_02100 [bacterium]|nr:hypothetical protein [bacterium]
MSKINSKLRSISIRIKHKRHVKLKKLKEQFAAAKHHEERQKTVEKIKKISPSYPIESLQEKSA